MARGAGILDRFLAPALFTRLLESIQLSLSPRGAAIAGDPARIDAVESMYRAASIRPCFRLRDDGECLGLEGILDARGYDRIHPTLVQTVDLASAREKLLRFARRTEKVETLAAFSFSENWVRAYAALNGRPDDSAEYWRTLSSVVVHARTLILRIGGEAVAAGSVIMDFSGDPESAGRWAGFYDLAVHPSRRGEGLGGLLLSSLVQEAIEGGAERGYLAVMEDNPPARGLYASAGFVDRYRYWYRKYPQLSSTIPVK